MDLGTGRRKTSTWKAFAKWISLVPVSVLAGLLGRVALVFMANLGLTFSGAFTPDSNELAVMTWLYSLAGDALAGGLVVWVASRWAPSRQLGSAIAMCLLVTLLVGASVRIILVAGHPTVSLPSAVALLVGALLGLGCVIGDYQGRQDWFESDLATGWHGVNGPMHKVLACLLALPLWWWTTDPVGEWHSAFSGGAVWWWPVVAGMWLWRVGIAAFMAYVVALVLTLLVLLTLKLPFLLVYRLRATTTPPTLDQAPGGAEWHS